MKIRETFPDFLLFRIMLPSLQMITNIGGMTLEH